MTQYSTDDLILYLYKETTSEQNKGIEKALQTDWSLKEQYNALKESMQGLDSLICSPRRQSVDAILEYARSTAEVAQP